jgi:hypothetical protein
MTVSVAAQPMAGQCERMARSNARIGGPDAGVRLSQMIFDAAMQPDTPAQSEHPPLFCAAQKRTTA